MSTKIITTKNVTDAEIAALGAASAEHDDFEQVAICELAITGNFDADDFTALSREEARKVGSMSQQDAITACVDVLNG